MTYRVQLSKKAEKEFEKLPMVAQGRLLSKIKALAVDPRPPGAVPLTGMKSSYRIRDDDYRALYTIHDDIVLVYVFRVEHRKDAYRNL